MKKSDSLFRLIHSLTKAEKRYFTLFSNLHSSGGKRYITLYNKFSKQDTFNEKQLRDEFRNDYSGNFGELKQLLTNQLLKALMNFHMDTTIEQKVVSLHAEIKILQRKGLYDLAEKRLNRAIQLCIEYERFTLLPNLLSHRKSLIMNTVYSDVTERDISRIIKEEDDWMKKMLEVNRYVNILFRYFQIPLQHRGASRKRKLLQYQVIVNDPLIKNGSSATTFSSKSIILHILANYYEETHQPNKQLQALNKHLELYDRYDKIKGEYFFNYLNIYYNFIDALIANNRLDEAAKLLLENQRKKQRKKGHEALFSAIHLNAELVLYIKTSQLSEADKLLRWYDRQCHKYPKQYSLRMNNQVLYYAAAVAFLKKDYNGCIAKLQNLINQPRQDYSLVAAARLLLLLCHFELNNSTIISHLAKSAKTALANHSVEKSTPDWQLANFLSKTTMKSAIPTKSELLAKIQTKDPLHSTLYPIDVIQWLQNGYPAI